MTRGAGAVVRRKAKRRWQSTDVPAFAHLTDADIENLAVELDAIRQDIEDSRGERDSRYIRRTIAAQRALEVAGRLMLAASSQALGVVGRHRDLGRGQDHREHGDRPQRHARPVGLDERSRDSLLDVGVGHERGVQALAFHPQLHAPQVHQHPRHGRRRGLRRAARHPRPAAGSRSTSATCCSTPSSRSGSSGESACSTWSSARSSRAATTAPPPWCGCASSRSKAGQQVAKDYVAFPALTSLSPGATFKSTLKANAVANVIRNVWANAVIFCGHFPDGAEKFTKTDMVGETKGQWYLRQMLGSANFESGPALRFMSGNLCHQIEHHLYPDLPSNRLHEISIRVKEVCDKYDLPYTTGSFLVQYGKTWRTIAKLSLPDKLPARHRRRRTGDPQRADVHRAGARLRRRHTRRGRRRGLKTAIATVRQWRRDQRVERPTAQGATAVRHRLVGTPHDVVRM